MNSPGWIAWSLAVAALGGCRPSTPPAPSTPSVAKSSPAPELSLNGRPDGRVGPFVVDLDRDGVVDTMTLFEFPDSEMPPVFGALALHLSATSLDTILRGNWDPPDSAQFHGGPNLIATHDLFVARGPGDQTLLFLFGQAGIDPWQGLEIYAVSRRGVRRYYAPGPFLFDGPPTRKHGRIVGFSGLAGGWPEGMIMANGDTLGGGSYVPTLVLRLGESIVIDSTATQAATRKALGGFAGYEPSADVAVQMKDGSRFVISAKDSHRLP